MSVVSTTRADINNYLQRFSIGTRYTPEDFVAWAVSRGLMPTIFGIRATPAIRATWEIRFLEKGMNAVRHELKTDINNRALSDWVDEKKKFEIQVEQYAKTWVTAAVTEAAVNLEAKMPEMIQKSVNTKHHHLRRVADASHDVPAPHFLNHLVAQAEGICDTGHTTVVDDSDNLRGTLRPPFATNLPQLRRHETRRIRGLNIPGIVSALRINGAS